MKPIGYITPLVIALVGALLKYSRKRLKIDVDGNIDAEALTVGGIRKLLDVAQDSGPPSRMRTSAFAPSPPESPLPLIHVRLPFKSARKRDNCAG